MSQIVAGSSPINPILPADLDYLAANGYVLKTSKDDYDRGADEVARLTQLVAQANAESAQRAQSEAALREDERKGHSFTFYFEGGKDKEILEERIRKETAVLTQEEAELSTMEANVNGLIQEKSMIDRMVAYDGGYLSVTGLGTVVLNDLVVRNYRVSDEELPDFVSEIRATYAELRTIADRATSYVNLSKSDVPWLATDSEDPGAGDPTSPIGVPSSLWGTAIGLAKLRGDPGQIGGRFIEALRSAEFLGSDTKDPSVLMAAEILTALGTPDIQSLGSDLRKLEEEVRHNSVPKELSTGVAAAIMAGRRFDGTYPLDRFLQVKDQTKSYQAASILAVLNVPIDTLVTKFQGFRQVFNSWGYMLSEDTEIASAFLAIGELGVDEVSEKIKYIAGELHNYLQYPLVAASLLASIPVFEAHEVLDLMEKAVTLLMGYTRGLERSEIVALAVRMVHGVRNEIVKEIDSTATITETPVQFTYPIRPGLFLWYHPVIIAHSFHYAAFSGMGAFHPAHPHGVGGFAG